LLNSSGDPVEFHLPEQGRGLQWNLFVDTSAHAPADIFPELDGPVPPSNRKVEVCYKSMKVYVSEPLHR